MLNFKVKKLKNSVHAIEKMVNDMFWEITIIIEANLRLQNLLLMKKKIFYFIIYECIKSRVLGISRLKIIIGYLY